MPEIIAPQQRALALKDAVERRKEQFAELLPAFLRAHSARFFQHALTCLRNPMLLECTQTSVIDGILKSAQRGQPLDGVHACLVPYFDKKKNERQAQYIQMYRGSLSAARRSGEIRQFAAEVVYDDEPFRVTYGSERKIEHEPKRFDRASPEGVVAAYSTARWPEDGVIDFDVMGTKDIERIRNRAKAKDSGPWATDWVEMAKKTVFHRHCKKLPMSIEFHQFLSQDEEEAEAEPRAVEHEDVQTKPLPRRVEDLMAMAEPAPPEIRAEPELETVPPAEPQAVEEIVKKPTIFKPTKTEMRGVINALNAVGVTDSMIEARIASKPIEMTADWYTVLADDAKALTDGTSKISELFETGE